MTSLTSLGLSPSVIAKLSEADFLLSSDVNCLKPSELQSATNLTLKECAEVIRLANGNQETIASQGVTLRDILVREEDEADHILTFSESLDTLLGGGIPLKAISEISGTPGIGKTQLCLQVCISVQLPKCIGGVEGEAIYIDTEGSFNIYRLKEMAEWAQKHIHQAHKGENVSEFNIDSILKGVYYFRCNSHLELLAVIKHLYTFLPTHLKVRLIVIDSMAFHFRHDFTDMTARTSILCSLTQDLIQLAAHHKLAVVVTNQMTTKVESQGCSHVVTALGETWGHCPTIRLLLCWDGCLRMAKIIKAPHIPPSAVHFQITAGGIRNRQTETESQQRRKRKLPQE